MPRGVYEDVTGKKFNKLLVLKEFKEENMYYCKCKCECGNIKNIKKTDVVRGVTKSCGCLSRGESIIGKEFGLLTVLRESTKRYRNGYPLYECKCICGNTTLATKNMLKYRIKISCGCWRKSRARIDKIMETMKYVENTSIALISKKTVNSNNTSGFRGVSYDKTRNKWKAYIRLKYKTITLGRFNTKEEAIKARMRAEEKYYKPIIEKYKEINNL